MTFTHASGKVKLANAAAGMTREAHAVANGIPNEYLGNMEEVRELSALCAIIYSHFGDLQDLTTQVNGRQE
jgi:hypothetical protein